MHSRVIAVEDCQKVSSLSFDVFGRLRIPNMRFIIWFWRVSQPSGELNLTEIGPGEQTITFGTQMLNILVITRVDIVCYDFPLCLRFLFVVNTRWLLEVS